MQPRIPVTVPADGVARLSLRANKLELLERTADNLAHEIKNPLHSMVINLEVLKRRIVRTESAGTDEMLHYIGVLTSELERVSYRIDLLLHMIRPARATDAVPLTEVLDDLRELLEVEGARRGIRIELAQEGSARIPVARETARQLILNLAFIALDELQAGAGLRIGIDRSPDTLALVLSALPYEASGLIPDLQHAVANSTPPGGAARLTVARALAEELGGRLELGGNDGGSTITFSLSPSE